MSENNQHLLPNKDEKIIEQVDFYKFENRSGQQNKKQSVQYDKSPQGLKSVQQSQQNNSNKMQGLQQIRSPTQNQQDKYQNYQNYKEQLQQNENREYIKQEHENININNEEYQYGTHEFNQQNNLQNQNFDDQNEFKNNNQQDIFNNGQNIQKKQVNQNNFEYQSQQYQKEQIQNHYIQQNNNINQYQHNQNNHQNIHQIQNHQNILLIQSQQNHIKQQQRISQQHQIEQQQHNNYQQFKEQYQPKFQQQRQMQIQNNINNQHQKQQINNNQYHFYQNQSQNNQEIKNQSKNSHLLIIQNSQIKQQNIKQEKTQKKDKEKKKKKKHKKSQSQLKQKQKQKQKSQINQSKKQKIEESLPKPVPVVSKQKQNQNNQNNPPENSHKKQLQIKQQNVQGVAQIQQRMGNQHPKVPVPIITNTMIVKEAQKQRISSVYYLFNQYIKKYSKFHSGHQYTIRNIISECQRRKKYKILPCFLIKDYFTHIISTLKDFHQKSYKYKREDLSKANISHNSMINMSIDFKVGLDELQFVRKASGNQFLKFSDFIQKEIVIKMQAKFNEYSKKIDQAFQAVQVFRIKYEQHLKNFNKQITKVNKVYIKGKQGRKQDDDVFIEMAKFVKFEKDLRQALKIWGESLKNFRQKYMKIEQTLFQDIQQIFNNFKGYSSNFFTKDRHHKIKLEIKKMQNEIKQQFKFNKISVITDMDYIKYVLELDEKQKKNNIHVELKNKDFQKFLSLDYFTKFTGDASDLLKGTSSKIFVLKKPDCIFVNTISGNLVQFNKKTAELQQKFAIKDITAKIVSEGVVQFNEVTKNFIFTNNRTTRITFMDEDRAQQLIMFLNQQSKQDQIIHS